MLLLCHYVCIQEKLKKLLRGCRDENQTVNHSTRRNPVSIKDMRSVCPLELLEESSLAMPWLTDNVSVDR